MVREHFENIYRDKLKATDRKSNILVSPYFDTVKQGDLYDFNYLDFTIINDSDESIMLDIEIKIEKGDFVIDLSQEIIKEYDQKKTSKKKANSSYLVSFEPIKTYFPNLNIELIIDTEYYYIKRINRTNNIAAVTIAQRDTYKNIFLQDLIILIKRGTMVKGDIIIRSDAFTEGPFIRNFELLFDEDSKVIVR